MCEWCAFTLVLSAASVVLEFELRGLIALADNLLVRRAAPRALTPRAAAVRPFARAPTVCPAR